MAETGTDTRAWRSMTLARGLGFLFIAAGILVNKWSLAWLLAADQQIGSDIFAIAIASMQAIMIIAGIYLVLRINPLRVSRLVFVPALIIAAIGAWGTMGYLINPPPDFSKATLPNFDCSNATRPCNNAAELGLDDLPRYGKGVAIVDFDSDGLQDLFLTDADPRVRSDWGTASFYRQNPDGKFARVDLGLQADDFYATWAVSFGDYDNDGDPDLLAAGGGYEGPGSIAFYENQVNEGHGFVPRTAEVGLSQINESATSNGVARWWGISWADYNNDGFSDVALTRVQGQPLLLANTGKKAFVDATTKSGIEITNAWRRDGKNPVWIDYDNDGDSDLYLAGIGSHFLFRNDDDGAQFSNVTASVIDPVMPPTNWLYQPTAPAIFAAAALDFNQDGRDDLYFGRQVEQDLILINEGGTFRPLGRESGIDASLTPKQNLAKTHENTMGLGIADLNNDGWPDIVIGTGEPERAAADLIYCNQRGLKVERCTVYISAAADQPWYTRAHGVASGDLNNDGTNDLLMSLGGHALWDIDNDSDSREYTAVFLTPPDPAQRTATLVLEGTRSNRDALGAKIKVTADETHHYTIRSAQGFQSQNSQALVVSLGNSEAATIEVRWPAGGKSIRQVKAGDRLRIVEGSD